jgi:hypothetical protein
VCASQSGPRAAGARRKTDAQDCVDPTMAWHGVLRGRVVPPYRWRIPRSHRYPPDGCRNGRTPSIGCTRLKERLKTRTHAGPPSPLAFLGVSGCALLEALIRAVRAPPCRTSRAAPCGKKLPGCGRPLRGGFRASPHRAMAPAARATPCCRHHRRQGGRRPPSWRARPAAHAPLRSVDWP